MRIPCAGLIVWIALVAPAAAQLTPEWVARRDATVGFQTLVVYATTDSQGAVYVTGATGTVSTVTDILTIKYAPDGTELWTAQHAGDPGGLEMGRGITIDGAGDVIVIGRVGSDFTVIKYDPTDGSQVWAVRHDAGGLDGPSAVTTDDAGNIYVTGSSWPPGTDNQNDFYTAKFDSAGSFVWSARYNGPGAFLFAQDVAVDIALDSHGDVFVTGPSNALGTGTPDYVTIKYRGTDGAQLWLDRYAGAGANDVPVDLVIDPQDNVYVTGSSFQAPWRFATIKYRNADGARLWVALDAAGTKAIATRLALDSQGDVYVAGHADPDGDDGNFNENAVVARHRASDGARLWMTIYGENGSGQYDRALDIAVDASDNVYITGETGSFGASFDLLVLQYDAASGQVVAEGVYDSGAFELAKGTDLALDPAQNVIVAGIARNGNTEDRDFLTLKYPGQAAIPGDVDGDGDVDFADLAALLASYGLCAGDVGYNPDADFNGDGCVGFADLATLLANYGT